MAYRVTPSLMKLVSVRDFMASTGTEVFTDGFRGGREAIRGARLVANPGCYPTSVQLPLCPLLSAGLIEKEDIIVDAKSGVSGAGLFSHGSRRRLRRNVNGLLIHFCPKGSGSPFPCAWL